MPSIIFFGSFGQYSLTTLELLVNSPNINIVATITSPPRPGNRGVITPNPIDLFARKNKIPLFTPENLKTNLPSLPPADFILVAGYGLLIPPIWLSHPKYLALNAHPSLLPQYPGRFPIEWALLFGEAEVGLSFIAMSDKFDTGGLVYQQSVPLTPSDTRHSLYLQAFTLTGQIAPQIMSQIISRSLVPQPQPQVDNFYARGLTRQDGFIPFPAFLNFADNSSLPLPPWPLLAEINSRLLQPILPQTLIHRMFRAFTPWPGLWTLNPQGIRLIIKSLNPLLVQPEGKTPAVWDQIKTSYS